MSNKILLCTDVVSLAMSEDMSLHLLAEHGIDSRHNACQLKQKTRLLVNVDYTAEISPTAQSHNQGGGS